MARTKYSPKELLALTASVRKTCLLYWEQASIETRLAGSGWYPVAHEEAKLLAAHYKLSVVRAAAIIAVLSPLTRWLGNLEDAWAVCDGGKARHSLPANVAKAQRLLEGDGILEVLRGQKVTAFWQSLAAPTTTPAVTCDSWMARAFGLSQGDLFERKGVYTAVSNGVREAAYMVGVRPGTLQATVWLMVREAYERNNENWMSDLPTPY